MKVLISIILIVFFLSCNYGRKQVDYKLIATLQDNSVPELKLNISDSTKVLLVFPHSDDETVVAGLISFLKENGAKNHLLTLTHHPSSKNNEARINELNCSVQKLGIENLEIAGLPNNSWEDIMQDKITFWYDNKDSIKNIINRKINYFNPDFLITFDNELGAYGHPEHRISAQLTEDIFNENINNSSFSVNTLIQFTLPDKLEDFLMSKSQGYKLSKKLTGNSGLPNPDYSLDITKYWEIKNSAAQCHQSQRKILKKFFVLYDEKDKGPHIKAFNKEYYTVSIR